MVSARVCDVIEHKKWPRSILAVAQVLLVLTLAMMPVAAFSQGSPTLPPPSKVAGPLSRNPDGSIATGRAPGRASLKVGPGQIYKSPSEAAAVAQDGDRIEIQPGRYTDCAVWKANDLVIEGIGPGVVIGNKSCAGKGIFVLEGDNTTVRNLTLTGASVPDENGAGIRLDKGSLLVDRVKFINNQNGILGASNPGAKVIIRDSDFEGNGFCGRACAHGIYINVVDLLRVEHSRFIGTRQGHSIKSRALRTEVIDCSIADGPDGTSSYLIDAPNGGTLIVRGNSLEKGPHSENHRTAIAIGEEGVSHPTPKILITNNNFRNDGNYQTALIWNKTTTTAVLSGNKLSGRAVLTVAPDSGGQPAGTTPNLSGAASPSQADRNQSAPKRGGAEAR